ncbi:MAG TPA: DUF4147 domain-containing protein, partial [Spirochaetia bacterium]|nr:DUF4147 domain-containing protein [Spirochaetia bacterium]
MEQLGSAKEDLTRIARASLAAIDPRRMISRSLRLEQETLLVQTPDARHAFDLSRFQRILVLGFGKAAGSMAQGVEEVLGPRIDSGLIVVKPGREKPLRFIRQIPGGHPVP